MDRSFKVLKKAIDPVGVKEVAAQLGVSHSLIYKWCQESKEKEHRLQPSGAMNPLDRIRKLYEATGDIEVINWVCQLADGYFVRNPKADSVDEELQVLTTIQNLIKEFSETLGAISKSFHEDQAISRQEAIEIRREWEDLKRIGEGFVRACESGKFK